MTGRKAQQSIHAPHRMHVINSKTQIHVVFNMNLSMSTCNFLLHLAIGSGGNSISSNDLFSILLDNEAVKRNCEDINYSRISMVQQPSGPWKYD